MGGKLSSCVRGDASSPRLQLEHDGTITEQSNDILALIGDGRVMTNISIDGDTTAQPSQFTSAVFNVQIAIEQVFILCELGILSTIQFILDTHPETVALLNTHHACQINEIRMDLTPLQVAAACGHAEVVSYLLLIDVVSVDMVDSAFGMNALHLAAYLNKVSVVEVLCRDLRLDIMAKDHDGKTALHIATLQGNDLVVETILRMRPHIDLRCREDIEGNTFIHCAAKMAKEHMLQLFVDYINTQSCTNFVGMKEAMRIHQQLRHRKSILEMANFLGETAECIVNRSIEDMQRRLATVHKNTSDSTAADGNPDETDSVTTMNDFELRREQEMLDQLDAYVACLTLLQEACHFSPVQESLSSFGAHTGSSFSSHEHRKQEDKAAYSWSPRRERGNTMSDSVPTSPLELHID